MHVCIENPQWPNVDDVIEGPVATHPCTSTSSLRNQTAHAVGIVQPGFDYFTSKFDPENSELADHFEAGTFVQPDTITRASPNP